jgi:hypothetical protein
MNLQGLFRKYAKKPLYKTLEGTQRDLAPKNKHLEGSRTHLAEVDPEWGPHHTDQPSGGAGRPSLGAKWARLLECSSTAYEDQSKSHV